ncbi:uncharacterized protein si:ch211-197h24.6 [Trematomus bernacchii]|uniref:uncharacterized protein si:ch211-197h24.6 n=1 Tax=Trematomus bernacchii TaxID=40690 RepID=UPI00146B723A|nr:uncharacterized protein si:ch211-197h24.6 [Trematomus bernacchii]XP_033983603.1 uncharacterized protein si:ch211-197h24.6 [Trematomus bernacchii]
MEANSSANKHPPRNGPQSNPKRNSRRKQPQHSADIVFSKGATIQTLPALSKQLKGLTECVIGLQYVWEYRSPSKSVPPHYQCKLCAVSRLQHDMLAHVKGWKHSFRYLKKVHPNKVTHEEEEAIRDPAVRKTIKEVSAEVEKTEGRGQIKVILKEPYEVLAFKGLRSAAPKATAPLVPGMGPKGPPPYGPSGPRFSDSRFSGEFPPQRGLLSDYPGAEYGEPGFGGYDYPTRQESLGSGMDQRPYPDGMGHRPAGIRDSFGSGGGKGGYGRGGLLEDPVSMYPDEYHGNQMRRSQMNRPMDKALERPGLMGAAPETSNLPNTLLTYLDTFRIENESDAQLVLKVTQKLTDVLMDYRLRSVSSGSSLNSFSMNSTGFSSETPKLMGSSDPFSGPSRYSTGPKYYK